MRKLMWFAVGFGTACAAGAYLPFGNVLAVLAAVSLFLAGTAWLLGKRWKPLMACAVACVGLAVGFLWFWNFDGGYLSPARELDGVTTQASVEITDYSFEAKYGICADGNALWQGKTYRIRLYLNDVNALNPGDVVSGVFRFRITHEGGQDTATFHRGNGIALLAYQAGEISVERPNLPWWHYPAAYLRETILGTIQTVFPSDTESFARALLLGDDHDLGYEINTAFKISGIRHIIAVSGLHVSILFGLIYMIAGKRKVLTTLIGLPILVLFAAVAGFTPSVVRACVMNALMMLAMLFEKEYDPPTALAFSALVMLAVNPLVVTSVSFQLSVGCMAGIFLFANRIKNWLLDDKHLGHSQGKTLKAKLVRAFAGSVAVSLGAISLTTPLSAFYFGTVSLISPLTNLLTLWMVTFAFYGIMTVCALAVISTGFAQGLAWLVSWPIRYILAVASLLADVPMAAVYTRSEPIVCWMVLCYLLLAVFLLRKGKQPLLTSCVGITGLCAALLVSWILPMTDNCRMTVLDVGQGQSIILQGEGKTFVVDCGGDYADSAADITAETLLSMGIHRIDGLILTHYDYDHAGGAGYFLSRIDADALFLPVMNEESEMALLLGDWNKGALYYLEENLELSWGNSKLTVLKSDIPNSGNESSLCVLFQSANCDILITGDRGTLGEGLLMKSYDLPKLDVLVVGHHGAADAAGEALLAKTAPQYAVISVGAHNSYGHPAQETLDRLIRAGCRILRTDMDGTIMIRR